MIRSKSLWLISPFTSIDCYFRCSKHRLEQPHIPAGSLIKRADLNDDYGSYFGWCGLPLDIGTYNSAGTAIVATGIDAAIVSDGIDAVGETVRCDGTHTTTAGYVASDAYIGLKYNTAAYTAGVGKLYR